MVKFDSRTLTAIYDNRDDRYKKYNIAMEYSGKDGTIYWMSFYDKKTYSDYVVKGRREGGSYYNWDVKSVKCVGKYDPYDYDHEDE